MKFVVIFNIFAVQAAILTVVIVRVRNVTLEAWDGQKISSSKNVFLLNAAITETGKLSWLHAKYPKIVYGKDFLFIIRFLRSTTYQITESMQESL